ncbi:DUF4365 domain-containing protein [Polluticoccus soli]|uniref:DUF4365 domain-containing protein n=1 Tax=Polluticoccus soli TaxID=3034150 RepID=UPI0023E17E65|nr:DUF4365 domain-containing protein [Flavipsychrobacter sp. JY13-12]
MKVQGKKIIDAKPAGYPYTSSTEQEVRDIFHVLLDRKFIKGDVRTLDKVPNSDGILEITDNEQFPIGKIDIQLKTLQPKNYKKPSYQVETSLLAYCDISVIPVILIVVNRDDKKAYWKYFDRKTLIETSQRIKGKSVSIAIPIENCLDGTNNLYVADWIKIAKESIDKIHGYDEVLDVNSKLKESLEKLQTRLEAPTNLPVQVLKEIHEFIDIYNYILDREFNFVKKYLYPNYWKIGIGVFKYDADEFNYLLYPVEFKKEQTLVKSVKREDYDDIFQELYDGTILSIASKFSPEIIKETPWVYAYKELEKTINETIDKYTFIVPDEFSANEYLISFIDTFCDYLDFIPGLDSYSLKDLKLKLFSILPMLEAESGYYADWVKEDRVNIDHRAKISNQEFHRKKIQSAIEMISINHRPKVEVSLDSRLYSFNALKFYVILLEELGFDNAVRVYANDVNERRYSLYPWQKWSKETLWGNFKQLKQNFSRVFEKCLNEYFPNIKEYLNYPESSEYSLVHVLNYTESDSVNSRPHLETYHLRPFLPEIGEQYFYFIEDEQQPINREKYWLDRKFDVTISKRKYRITMVQGRPIDFMFKTSPMNELLKMVIKDRLKDFFKQRKSHERILSNNDF